MSAPLAGKGGCAQAGIEIAIRCAVILTGSNARDSSLPANRAPLHELTLRQG